MKMIWNKETLVDMKENELCKEVLIPLFESMGFKDVRFHGGGILEQGKDITMWREEPPRSRVNYAVVAKAEKISGNTSTGIVVTQAKQCFGATYIDTITCEECQTHHCFIVTSHEVKKEGAKTLNSLLKADHLDNSCTVIDGESLWALIQQYLPQKIIFSPIQQAYDALNTADPHYGVALSMSQDGMAFSVESKSNATPPIRISIVPSFLDTPEGKKKQEEYERFLKTGAPVQLDSSNVAHIELPNFLNALTRKSEDKYVITIGPSKPIRPVIYSLIFRAKDGEKFEFPYVDFTSIQGGTEEITFMNDEQPIPFKWKLQIDKSGHANLNYTANFAGRSVTWLHRYLEFEQILLKGCEIILKDLETGIEISAQQEQDIRPRKYSDGFRKTVEQLVEIQRLTKTSIVVPDRDYFTEDDIISARHVENLLKTGRPQKPPKPPKEITLTIDIGIQEYKNWFSMLLDGNGHKVSLIAPQRFEKVLDTVVPVGQMETCCECARLHPEDVAIVKQGTEMSLNEKNVSFRLVACEGAAFETRYPQWEKENT